MKKIFITTLVSFLVCISSRVLATTYTFTGSGSWSSSSNWDINGVPPNPLTSGNTILINGTGAAILDTDITIDPGNFLSISIACTLIINSTRTMTSYSQLGNSGNLINDGSIILINVVINNIYGSTTLTNNGIISCGLVSQGTVTNNGTLNINLVVSPGNSGTFYNIGTLNINTNGRLENTGTLNNTGIMNNSGTFLQGPGATLTNNNIINNNTSGILNSSGILNNNDTLNNNSGASLTNQNTGTINNNSTGVLNNNSGGTLVYINGSIFNNNGILNNNLGGSLTNAGNMENNAAITNGGMLTNNGTLNNNITGTLENTGTLTNGFTMTNSGTLLNNGTFNQNQNFSHTGTYSGVGTFNGSLFTNNGIVLPGASPGCMTFSTDYTNIGLLNMEINGTTACTQFDQLNLTGTATVGGTLAINFGFTPTIGQTFQIINAGSFGGSFSNIFSIPAHSISYSNGVVTVNLLLSVKLISFNATLQQNDVAINWIAVDAVNFKHFEIERSTDGISFILIGQKNPISGSGEIRYVYTDANAANIFRSNDNVYYRLKMIDMDGKFSYSNIVKVSFKKSNAVFVINTQPNPFTDKININLSMSESGVVIVKLIDIQGRTVIKKQIAAGRGFGTILIDGLEKIESGMFLLQIQSEQGIVTEKAVKK